MTDVDRESTLAKDLRLVRNDPDVDTEAIISAFRTLETTLWTISSERDQHDSVFYAARNACAVINDIRKCRPAGTGSDGGEVRWPRADQADENVADPEPPLPHRATGAAGSPARIAVDQPDLEQIAPEDAGGSASDRGMPEPEPPAPVPPAPVVPGRDPETDVSVVVAQLWQDLGADQQNERWAGTSEPLGDGAGQRWQDLHLMLLRLPKPAAVKYRAAARDQVRKRAARWPSELFPAGDAAELPPLTAVGFAGLVVGSRTERNPAIAAAAGAVVGLFPDLVPLFSDVVAVLNLDDRLWHSLEAVSRRPARLADPDARTKYQDAVLNRLRNLSTVTGAANTLNAMVAVDETVRSLFHLPIASGQSWWGDLRRRSQRLVETAATTAGATLRDPTDTYTLLAKAGIVSGDEAWLPSDHGSTGRGTIRTSLRLAYRLSEQEPWTPGRVLMDSAD